MKKLLNTLYVTRENGYLGLDGENIVIKRLDGFLSTIWKVSFLLVIGEPVRR